MSPQKRAEKIKAIVDIENKIAEIESTPTNEFMKHIKGLEDLSSPGIDKRLRVRTEVFKRLLGGKQ